MKIVWDERNNRINIARHRLDFIDAARIFVKPLLTQLDERQTYGTNHWTGIGMLDRRAVVIVYTELNLNTLRVLSLRKALPHERQRYEQKLRNELGAS